MMQLLRLWRRARASFLQTARGRDLDVLADNVFGVTRISRRPRWWPCWWPRMWPFVESDRSLRGRARAKVEAISLRTVAPGASIRAGELVGMRADGMVEPMKARKA